MVQFVGSVDDFGIFMIITNGKEETAFLIIFTLTNALGAE